MELNQYVNCYLIKLYNTINHELEKPMPTKEQGKIIEDQEQQYSDESWKELLIQLVAHLRQNQTQLRQEWARRITQAKLLTVMSPDEIFAEATTIYDNYVEALESGTFKALQGYARNLSERIIPRGVEIQEVIGIVLLLRDILARSLFAKYRMTLYL